MAQANVTEALNRQVSNWNVLFVKLHNYHWFVKGPHFFTLHEKFEELYNEAAGHIDELAERQLTIGGAPLATMREFLEAATIKEAEGEKSAEEMVQDLSSDFEKLSAELGKDIEACEEAGDDATADMFIAIRQSVEKHNWMLKAFSSK
ncbi:Dps family protein [Texcoconibacillus texcoconensis]|uniref:Starvation-inducible DNA-binding protein n=1 Tax=Texcoconibacillus texcoconensis TaxID=1095777 RepID=A0A840QLG9_9BACI|nr:Dps family protein [Texcoconibacillus texcoconensis]MBB5172215.1 starvation-inducible DNA-binding protein [Texcoconibacillus texcoconensis]